MIFGTQLFESKNLLLEAYDLEKDPAVEAGFSYDLKYAAAIDFESVPHPMTAFEIKTKREGQLKKSSDANDIILFAVRAKSDGQFLGVLIFPWITWFNRFAFVRIAIGESERWGVYYPEVLEMAMRYGLEELGLYSICISTNESEPEVLAALQNAGFQIAARQRENIFRNGRLLDHIYLEFHQDEWQKPSTEVHS